MLELYSRFNRTARKQLLETIPPRLQDALRQADARMKAVRTAVTEASADRRTQARREAEQGTDNVIAVFEEKRRQRETLEQYAEKGA